MKNDIKDLECLITAYGDLRREQGRGKEAEKIIREAENSLRTALGKLNDLENEELENKEKSDWETLSSSFPPDETFPSLSDEEYRKKLAGGIIGRFSGCVLGAPVEFVSPDLMQMFASITGDSFPPVDYWKKAPSGYIPRYKVGFPVDLVKEGMRFCPVDDDIAYTLLSLLAVEKKGRSFTTEELSEVWMDLIPRECAFTAERNTLNNLDKGLSLPGASVRDNPDQELIGAIIRADGWAYMNPLEPRKAVEMAWKDAWLTHRKSGLYGEMYFAAVISMSFSSLPLRKVFEKALSYIPSDSRFAESVRWALEMAPRIKTWKDAHDAVAERFNGYSQVHSENNACLVIWGSLIGEEDHTKAIGETVAMGFDNDCTAATVGSIVGVHLSIDRIERKWYEPWNGRVQTYFNGYDFFELEDIINRFFIQGRKGGTK